MQQEQKKTTKEKNIYHYLFVAALLALAAFVLFGPIKEADKTKAYLWKQNWEKIVYKSLDKNSAKYSSPQGPEKEIVFYRKGGLSKDLYFVDSRLSTKNISTKYHPQATRRQANAQVANLFRDWRKPEEKGLYQPNPKLKALSGLDAPTARIEFYSSATEHTPTLYILVGQKQKKGTYFIEIHEGSEPPVIALIQGYYITKFLYDLDRYRERRFLVYPAGSYLTDVQISIKTPDKGKQKLHLVQKQTKEEKGVVTKFYRIDGKAKTEIPAYLAQALLGSVKQIQIKRFSDEREIQKLALSHWPKESPFAMELRIENSQGDVFEARLAKIEQERFDQATAKWKNALVYFQNRKFPLIDFADKNLSAKIEKQMQTIRTYKAQEQGTSPSSIKNPKKSSGTLRP